MSFLATYQAQIVEQYASNSTLVTELQETALKKLLPELIAELNSPEEDEEELWERGKSYLEDTGAIFRHLRKCKFDLTAALSALRFTLQWRIKSSVDTVVPFPTTEEEEDDIHFYVRSPLMFYHPELQDKWGRPCAVINVKQVKRYPEGSLEGLKEFIAFQWELGRRYLSEIAGEDMKVLQMVLIVDLDGAGMSNMEVELLPFFLDLLRSHFPGMVGAIFILNYGWMYSGVWQVMKKLLPQSVIARILFPKTPELLEFFEPSNLLKRHGGELDYTFSTTNSILLRHGSPLFGGEPLTQEPQDHTLSRASSYSAATTSSPARSLSVPPSPKPQRGRLGWLNMTRLTSSLSNTNTMSKSTERRISYPEPNGGSTPSSENSSEEDDDADDESASDTTVRDRSAYPSAYPSARSSPATRLISLPHPDHTSTSYASLTRISSRAQSRASSPQRRRRKETFTSMGTSLEGISGNSGAGRITWRKELGRYHESNPFFGYRSEEGRRRKRDLVRTLTYLAALRFLALHRRVTGVVQSGFSAIGRLRSGRKRRRGRWNWLVAVVLLLAFRNGGFDDVVNTLKDGCMRALVERGLISG
ncbi:hypothetical protein BT69DRAFT_1286334 [Atractiella rhizophila]|nr:hypothetical protein BT69DRAFT_1286334 [Atractiella rhizophila]